MKTKTKLIIVGVIAFLGIFANTSIVSAQTNITTDCHSVTINGYVGLNGNTSASVWFKWGLSQSLGNSTSPQTFSSDSNFSQLISGLIQNTTYYYQALGSSDDSDVENGDIKTFTVTCAILNPTVTLTADNSSISYNGNTTLRWSSTTAVSCNATGGSNGWSGNKSTTGTFYTGPLTNATTYNITCVNSVGSANASATVNVTQNQTCQDSSANNYGGTLPCTYYTQTCQDPNAINYRGTLPCSYPQIQVCQDSSALNYRGTLPCRYPQPQVCQDPSALNYRGILPCTYQSINQQPTVVLYTDQTSVPYNGTATIRWITTNSTSCNASSGSIGWAGIKSIGPGSFYTGSLTGSKTYVITCSNNFGSATDSASVTVRGQTITTTTNKPALTSLVLITSSVDRNQPIVPTIDNTRPKPGDEINYTVSYQNIGTGAITSLTLRIDLPYEVDYLFSNPSNPIRSGQTLIFNLGTLKANGQGTVTVRVRVRDNIPAGTNLNFPALLSYVDPSGQLQSVTANVSAQVWTEPTAPTTPTVIENVIPLGANVFGAGFLPTNLFGWLLLLILILILIFLARYLLNDSFNKKTIVVSDQPLGRKTTTTTIQ